MRPVGEGHVGGHRLRSRKEDDGRIYENDDREKGTIAKQRQKLKRVHSI